MEGVWEVSLQTNFDTSFRTNFVGKWFSGLIKILEYHLLLSLIRFIACSFLLIRREIILEPRFSFSTTEWFWEPCQPSPVTDLAPKYLLLRYVVHENFSVSMMTASRSCGKKSQLFS